MELILFIVLGILIIMGALCVVGLVKNRVVYKHHRRAIEIVYGDERAFEELHKKYIEPDSYDQHFYHPLKWTFESMFPGLESRQK